VCWWARESRGSREKKAGVCVWVGRANCSLFFHSTCSISGSAPESPPFLTHPSLLLWGASSPPSTRSPRCTAWSAWAACQRRAGWTRPKSKRKSLSSRPRPCPAARAPVQGCVPLARQRERWRVADSHPYTTPSLTHTKKTGSASTSSTAPPNSRAGGRARPRSRCPTTQPSKPSPPGVPR